LTWLRLCHCEENAWPQKDERIIDRKHISITIVITYKKLLLQRKMLTDIPGARRANTLERVLMSIVILVSTYWNLISDKKCLL
jgi:hypothetical protein